MGHYYDINGEPCYEIVGKNGKKRTPYLKEAKELGLSPGVTTITGQIKSEAINIWGINSAVQICMDNPYCSMGMSKETWLQDINNRIRKERDRITGQGSKIHDALEVYYKTGKIDKKYEDYIQPVIDLIAQQWPQLKRTDWIAEKAFNYKGWYGGKVDLHTPLCGGIVLDFKTKDTTDIKKFKPYESHKQQLVAYSYGLGQPMSQIGDIFLSALAPNILSLEMVKEDEKTAVWDRFRLLVSYWHLENYNQYIA